MTQLRLTRGIWGSRRSLPSGRQYRARLDARFVRPTPGPRPPSSSWSGEGLLGQPGRLAPGYAHVECGWWGEAVEPAAGRLGCARGESRLASGRETVCVCVRARGRVSVILHLESTWGEEYSVWSGREWMGTTVYSPQSTFPSFPVQWADAAGTRS